MTNANTTTAIVPAKDLNALEFRIAQGIGFSTPDEIAATWQAIDFAREFLKAIEAAAKAHTEAYLQLNGEFQVGDIKYYLGKSKTTKLRDVKSALDKLLGIFSIEQIAQSLSANALKPGQVRTYLKELGLDAAFDEIFVTTVDEGLERDKPKSLKRLDTRFLPK